VARPLPEPWRQLDARAVRAWPCLAAYCRFIDEIVRRGNHA
jgi:hypothetical protein